MRICGDPTAWMLDQQHVAETAQFIPRVGNDPVGGSPHRSTGRRRNIDAIVEAASSLGAEVGDDAAFYGPDEGSCDGRWRRRRLDRPWRLRLALPGSVDGLGRDTGFLGVAWQLAASAVTTVDGRDFWSGIASRCPSKRSNGGVSLFSETSA